MELRARRIWGADGDFGPTQTLPGFSVGTRSFPSSLSGQEISRALSFIQRGDLPPKLICCRHNTNLAQGCAPPWSQYEGPLRPPPQRHLLSEYQCYYRHSSAAVCSQHSYSHNLLWYRSVFCFLQYEYYLSSWRTQLKLVFLTQGTTFIQLSHPDGEHWLIVASAEKTVVYNLQFA